MTSATMLTTANATCQDPKGRLLNGANSSPAKGG